MSEIRWTRIVGDGLVYSGPCIVYGIVMVPDAGADYADIYDGRDTTTGRKFCRVVIATKTTHRLNFGQGIPFHMAIYVDGSDGAVATTLIYAPCD